MNSLNKIKTVLFVAAFLFLPYFMNRAYAPPNSPGGGSDPGCWPPPCIPIDGGASFLLAAGALYGSKKAYDFRKKKQEDQEEDRS